MSLRARISGISMIAALATGGAGTAGAVGMTAGAASAASAAVTTPASYQPPGRVLREGSSGSDVRALQRRLAALMYYPGAANGHFGASTLEAVWAFQEVNQLPVSGAVGPRTKAALVHPHAYQARYPHQAGTRVEVNLGMGVLVFYRDGQIALVSHESSGGHYYYGGGAYAVTPTGAFRALRFVPGWDHSSLGYLYNPVYFHGGYAIHGDTSVPANPVSHGCVRIPMDIATWFHKDLRTGSHGTEVWIYNQW